MTPPAPPAPVRRELAALLGTLRGAAGLSQSELARRARCTRPYVSQLEGGARQRPSRAVALRLATALGLQGEARQEFLTAAGWPDLEQPLSDAGDAAQALARQLVDGLPYPAALHDSRWIVGHANGPLERLFGVLGVPMLAGGSLLEDVFDPALRARLPDWEGWARAMLAQFKRDSGHLSHTPAQQALLVRLHALPDFPRLWRHVEASADTTPAMPLALSLPGHGPLHLEVLRLQVVGLPELWLVTFLPVGAAAQRLLAAQ